MPDAAQAFAPSSLRAGQAPGGTGRPRGQELTTNSSSSSSSSRWRLLGIVSLPHVSHFRICTACLSLSSVLPCLTALGVGAVLSRKMQWGFSVRSCGSVCHAPRVSGGAVGAHAPRVTATSRGVRLHIALTICTCPPAPRGRPSVLSSYDTPFNQLKVIRRFSERSS